eukprot:TRINITY_DN2660_c2_g1_i5.p1 TRINITY_DN2660_c2_g1~~TRINITY_DN2660_c2_g1_i5.p1  ORF type:complete len:6207 (+),score=1618.57 TRINITY_DN2660_c2_g1_i5:144-18764(+)
MAGFYSGFGGGKDMFASFARGNPDLIPNHLEKWVEDITKLVTRVCDRRDWEFVATNFRDLMERDGIVGAVPCPQFCPAVLAAARHSKKLCQEYNDSTNPAVLLAFVTMHRILAKLAAKASTHTKNDDDVHVKEIARTRLELQDSINVMCIKHVDRYRMKLDLDSLQSLTQRIIPGTHASQHTSQVTQHVILSIEDWLLRLPYGKKGAAAYRMLLDYKSFLSNRQSSWKVVLAGLLDQPRDARRCAELLLWQAHPKSHRQNDELAPIKLDDQDADYFLHHAADGVPPEEVWNLLLDHDRIGKAKQEADRHQGDGDRRQRGRHNRDNDLEGRWLSQHGTFNFHHAQAAGSPFTMEFRSGETVLVGEVFKTDEAPGSIPACPMSRVFPSHAVRSDDITFWISTRGDTMHMLREQTQIEVYYVVDSRRLLQELAAGAVSDETRKNLHKVTAVKDDISSETVVAFCARVLQNVLQAPPTPGLEDKFEVAFKDLQGFADYLVVHMENSFGARKLYPETLILVLKAMLKANSGMKEKIYGQSGFLLKQATREPCINLVAIYGRVLEENLPLVSKAGEVVNSLKRVAQGEIGKSGDPLAVLQSLNAVSRHDFDGTWTWLNGYKEKNYSNAFTITGHHVTLNDPAFYGGVVKSVRYVGSSLFITIVINEKVNSRMLLERGDDFDRHVNIRIEMTQKAASTRSSDEVHGKWTSTSSSAETYQRPECVFSRTERGTVSSEWDQRAIALTQRPLEDAIAGWDASGLDDRTSAAKLLENVICDRALTTPQTRYEKYVLNLWERCCSQVVKSNKFNTVSKLDDWILHDVSLFTANTGMRQEASRLMLDSYFKKREITWQLYPVPLSKVDKLVVKYLGATNFKKRIVHARDDLQRHLDAHKISNKVYSNVTSKWHGIHSENGIKFPSPRLDFVSPVQGLEEVKDVLRELIENWCLKAAHTKLEVIETMIRDKDLVALTDLETTLKETRAILGPVLAVQDATISPLLRAHFLKCLGGKELQLDAFALVFENACTAIRKIKLDTKIIDAVADLFPMDGKFSGARLEQERALLERIGMPSDVVSHLLNGALPLRFIIHDMQAFRDLADTKIPDLMLHPEFFTNSERDVLLDEEVNNLPIYAAKRKCDTIKATSGGCHHRVLEIIRTVLNCSKLVEFTRENPQAQDAGLSNVLSNSRDLQHASFQTFLNCAPYINPFVAASAMHVAKYKEKAQQLMDEKRERGEEPVVTPEEVRSASIRLPINNNESWSKTQPEGFWELMNASFGDEDLIDVRNVQRNLERMTTADQIEGLEKMIKEQNGATDRMIAQCHIAAGLPGHPPGTVVNEGAPVPESEPASIIIYLPPTGQPSLACDIGDVTKNGSEYQDLVYRATLQKGLDNALDVFVGQAREVLRAFNAACGLFSEGHLEFRSRKLQFKHNDAARVTTMLQSLLGQWSTSDSEEQSVFEEMCGTHPELSCLTPAELVRMAELMRGVCSEGDVNHAEASRMMKSWKGLRSRTMNRKSMSADSSENIEGTGNASMVPKPTECTLVVVPEVTGQVANTGTPLLLESCGVASGKYVEGLPMYKRCDDAVLSPVENGWAIHSSPTIDAERLLTSVAEHESYLQPWAMGDWRGTDFKGGLQSTPCLNARVQIDGGHLKAAKWSEESKSREDNVRVVAPGPLKPMDLTVNRASLYVKSVEKDSLWESLGLIRGTRIVQVTTERVIRGTADELQRALKEACTDHFKGFALTVQSPWIWLDAAVSPDIDVSENGRSITKNRGAKPSIAVSPSPAGGKVWRVRVSGDALGMRVGLCAREMDHKLTEADSAPNKDRAYWYMRHGSLRTGGKDVAPTRAFKSGDIITIRHSGKAKTIEFFLNGQKLSAMFTDVKELMLHPCVYLSKKTATISISPGAPVEEVLEWNPKKLGPHTKLSADRRTVEKAGDADSSVSTGAIGGKVMVGPGPHKFAIRVKGRGPLTDSCTVGVAPPGVFLNKAYEPQTSMFGMTVRPDGNVFGLQSSTILHTGQRLQGSAAIWEYVFTFTVDLGEGTIMVMRDDSRVVHSSLIPDFPKATGPLVPFVTLSKPDIQCTFEPCKEEVKQGEGKVSVIVKGTNVAKNAKKPGTRGVADGLYHKWIPTYKREDGAYSISYWNGRWCVSDTADRPVAWSSPCSPDQQLGTESLRWTKLVNYEQVPKYIRLVVPEQPGGILELQKEKNDGRVVYANQSHKLIWSEVLKKWMVTKLKPEKRTVAYYISPSKALYPHCCSSWSWGNGTTWLQDDRIRVAAVDQTPLREDSKHLVWTQKEYGTGWEDAAEVKLNLTPSAPNVDIGISIRLSTAEQGTVIMDTMTADELAGWHVVRKASGASVRAPDLRKALLEVSRNATSGLCMDTDWKTTEEATKIVRANAVSQLRRIGDLLRSFKGAEGHADPWVAKNFTKGIPRYGQLQARVIEGAIVDVSRLPISDRRLFGLSLFEGDTRPYHVLDCYSDTPPEDVTSFIMLYKMVQKGRFVVFNLQELGPDTQNEIRLAIDAAKKSTDKELLALVTDGDGTDETIEFVDAQACDVRWKKWAMARAAKLKKFKTITYYAQKPGTGKSYTINRNVKEGKWGEGVEATRLDLDSTKESMDHVCSRLMAPLRAKEGLLIIHVGHDTNPRVVNQVLDNLIFFGRVQSTSGLSVSIKSQGWHLVVEFQEPPAPEVGHVVNDPWRNAEGKSEITLLSCADLAEEGALAEYDLSEYPGVLDALKYFRTVFRGTDANLPTDDMLLVRMLAMGICNAPKNSGSDADTVAHNAFLEAANSSTPRLLSRSIRYLVRQYKIFQPEPNAKDITLAKPTEQNNYKFAAHILMHEMHHFVNPSLPDHFHAILQKDDVKDYMQLAGNPSPDLQESIRLHEEDLHQRFLLFVSHKEAAEEQHKARQKEKATAPMYWLAEILSEELGVDKKLVMTDLRENNCVLTRDFLQKLIQLNNRINLNDPPILQGPSGTGKSNAVRILTSLRLLPLLPGVKQFNTHSDTNGCMVFYKWTRVNLSLRKLFPNDNSRVEVDGQDMIWTAMQKINTKEKARTCFAELVDCDNVDALNYVRECVNDFLGHYYEVWKEVKATSFRTAVEVLKNDAEPGDPKRAETLSKSVLVVADTLSKNWSGLASEVAICLNSAIRSSKMKEKAGRLYEEFIKVLDADPLHDAFKTWAREAVLAVKGNSETLCQIVKERFRDELRNSPLLNPSAELVQALADTGTSDDPTTGEKLGEIIVEMLKLKRENASVDILMRYDLTPELLFDQMRPVLERALECPSVKFMVMIDEMNATKMLGLVKRIVVDRYWDRWEDAHPESRGYLPPNVNFVGAVNPSKKDAILEGTATEESDKTNEGAESLGFDVTPMPPSLMEYIVPWKQLAEGQRELFISRLIGANKNLFSADIRRSQIKALDRLLLNAHRFAQKKCQNKRSTVSQRDLHRAMKLFDFFYKYEREFVFSNGSQSSEVWERSLSSMLLGIAVSYYFRFAPDEREELSTILTALLVEEAGKNPKEVRALPDGVTFADVVKKAVSFFCHNKHLKLPEAVYAHQGLMENLFVQMVCFDIRLAVILEGAPGTSKTLSNNIIRDNMTGTGLFWKDFCHISDICRYQGSAQSSAGEIKRKCQEAYTKQKENDDAGSKNKRTLLFVDEAGLVKGETDERKWALKVLHYYLEGANLSSVLMTNATLDPAIGNRCIVVYMAKPESSELTNMCAGILHKHGRKGLSYLASKIVPVCCDAFHKLVPQTSEKEELVGYDPSEKFRWWYGLRDLFHMMRYIRRYQPNDKNRDENSKIDVTPELVMRALERNFNGPSEFFEATVKVFGEKMGAIDPNFSADKLRDAAKGKIDIVLDSIRDNNRATEQSAGKNLNDMWVRFKLLVDTTEDGSLLQLLRQSDIPHFCDLSVLSLSALSKGDELMPVTVVSQIAAAMETGKTVWLTNTREIDACLFDVFNQNYVVASSGANEVLHFVAIAIGAALEYKQVHKDFQCIVHVTKRELKGMGRVLPSPFLNRLEKFTISVADVVSYVGSRMLKEDGLKAARLRQKLESFEKTLSVRNRCVFSDSEKETFDSILLEAIQQNKLKDRIRINSRITADDALSSFVFGSSEENALWRSLSCRLLQVLRPEGMILAQRVLKGAPSYMRAYFRDLSPWSLENYLIDLRNRLQQANAKKNKLGWTRSVIYSPANVDFPSLIEEIDSVSQISVDGLLDSERGHEDLKEELYKFCLAPDKTIFVVVMSPDSLGKPESMEVRHMLDTPPELKEGQSMQNKAVCVLHAFHATTLTGSTNCTPLFGCGWDQVYIDAAGEHVSLDILRYVDPSISGRRAPKPLPEWKDMLVLLDQAMNGLMQAQSEASTRWAPVAANDPAAVLYDIKKPFSEQVTKARNLLEICPKVRKTLLNLYRARLPTDLELVEMAKDVVASERSLSLAQRLIDEENTAPRALLTFALRFLLDDRNASALLSFSKSGTKEDLAKSDDIIARALEVAASATTFDHLRHMKVNTLPPLYVGASMPALPGSSSLMETLPIPAGAFDVVAEAIELQKKYEEGPVGTLVKMVNKDARLVTAFFHDNIRSRVRYNDEKLVRQVVEWTLELSRGMYKVKFGNEAENVWRVRALCCVESAAIDDYILAMVPLAATGTLDGVNPAAVSMSDVGNSHVAHELCPKLLIEALPRMAGRLGQFRMACSSMLHRVTSEWVVNSKTLPCLAVLGGLLSDEGKPKVKEAITFSKACMAKKSLDFPTLEAAMTRASVPKVSLALAKLYKSGDEIPLFLWKQPLSRAMHARVMSFIITEPEAAMKTNPAVADVLLKAALAQMKLRKASNVTEVTFSLPTGKTAEPNLVKELNASVYLALYDLLYDRTVGMNTEALDASLATKIATKYLELLETEKALKKSYSCSLFIAVHKKALEVAFLQALAFVFRRPPSEQKKTWEPVLMTQEAVKNVTKVAKLLMEPTGFVCPKRSSDLDRKLTKKPPSAVCETNMLMLLHALENGVGTVRGMGTKAMLEYLQDQVPVSDKDSHIGALVKVCGAGMQHKCQNAEPMVTRPGDLPFVYKVDEPLYEPFITLRRQLNLSSDAGIADGKEVDEINTILESILKKHSKTEARLLLFYTSFKCFFGEKITHKGALKIVKNDKLKSLLDLNEKQLLILHIALDPKQIPVPCPERVNVMDSLSEGFKQEWTEMVIPALAVACSDPTSLLYSLYIDIDEQKNLFLPGDKTGSAITHGGGYKLDCVTQLDENGNIHSYARGQPVMSTGSCYLLWGILFGGLALQLLWFPGCHSTIWNWVVSSSIHSRTFSYQHGTSNYRHLAQQLTERSVAYHLHMGAHTGLSVDESQRMYAFLTYEFTKCSTLQRKRNNTREAAIQVESKVEDVWKLYTGKKRSLLTRPSADMCFTLKALHDWGIDTKPHELPRSGKIFSDLECLGAQDVPKLLNMALHEREKLSLLAPLLTDLYSFASRVHRMLTNRLPTKYQDQGEELPTAYQSVLDLFKEYTPVSQYEVAIEQLARIKNKWNTFRSNVGPIDFECEEGGINIVMEEREVQVGAAGLPDTLDFWITMPDGIDAQHRNLVKAALLSLTEKYNQCQAITSHYTKTECEDEMEAVDPMLLNPSKPDLMLREHNGLGEVCRSHVTDTETNWTGIETELSFASGLLLPKLLSPVLPVFRFLDPEDNVQSHEVQQQAADLLMVQPDRHLKPLTQKQEENLRTNVKHFNEEQNISVLVGLISTFKARDTTPTSKLYPEVTKRWGQKVTMPLRHSMLSDIVVEQTRGVLNVFMDKLEQNDWLTAHIGTDLHIPISSELLAQIDERLVVHLRSNPPDTVLEELEEILDSAGNCCSSGEYLRDTKASLSELLSAVLLFEDNHNPCDIFEGVLIENIVPFIKLVRKKLRKLRSQASSKTWKEEGAELREVPHTVVLKKAPLAIMYDDDLTITSVGDGAGASAGLQEGMRIVAIGEHRVRDRQEADDALTKMLDVFEISVALATQEQHGDDLDVAMHHADKHDDVGLDRDNSWASFIEQAKDEEKQMHDLPRCPSSSGMLGRSDSFSGTASHSRPSLGAGAVPAMERSGLPRSQSNIEAKELEHRMKHGLGERQGSSTGLGERQDSSAYDDAMRRQKHEVERREDQEEQELSELEQQKRENKLLKDELTKKNKQCESVTSQLTKREKSLKDVETKLHEQESINQTLATTARARQDEIESQRIAAQRAAKESESLPDFK